MNRKTDHAAKASAHLRDASELAKQHWLEIYPESQMAYAQVLATVGLAEAVLALAQQFYDDGGGSLPISGSIPLTLRAEP